MLLMDVHSKTPPPGMGCKCYDTQGRPRQPRLFMLWRGTLESTAAPDQPSARPPVGNPPQATPMRCDTSPARGISPLQSAGFHRVAAPSSSQETLEPNS